MPRHLVTLFILALALAASSCSNQSAFEPSQPTVGDDQLQPSFNGGTGLDPTPRKGGPGGSIGGWKK
jgi:hypothetical protein